MHLTYTNAMMLEMLSHLKKSQIPDFKSHLSDRSKIHIIDLKDLRDLRFNRWELQEIQEIWEIRNLRELRDLRYQRSERSEKIEVTDLRLPNGHWWMDSRVAFVNENTTSEGYFEGIIHSFWVLYEPYVWWVWWLFCDA